MDVRILAIGDIVGKPGRNAVEKLLPDYRRQNGIDFVIANAENIAGGSGMTDPLLDSLFESGVDAVTSGDHVWKRKNIAERLDSDSRVIRPANLPRDAAGSGWTILKTAGGAPIAIINILGQTFMNLSLVDNPFLVAETAIENVKSETQLIFVDFHAEATSEKVALGWFLDGRTTAVFGTHTHVPTADFRILPKGTAYITDLGMTGPYESVLGRRIDRVLHRFITSMPTPFDVAQGDARMCGIIVTAEAKSGSAISIERIEEKL
ncbi:MAG: TIGR00282 family metallophosphoesterase [Planctomycetota bacterium]